MIFDLVSDFADLLDAMPEEHPRYRTLRLLDSALRMDLQFIERHPTTLFQCLWNTCWWYDCPNAAKHFVEPQGGWPTLPPWLNADDKLYRVLEGWQKQSELTNPERFWIRSLRPPYESLSVAQLAVCIHDVGVVAGKSFTGAQLRHHSGSVRCLAYSHDGRRVATGTDDSRIRIWNASTGFCELVIDGHAEVNSGYVDGVNAIAFSSDDRWIISAANDNTVRVWNAVSGLERKKIGGRLQEAVERVEIPGAHSVARMAYRTETFRCLAISSDGQLVACPTEDLQFLRILDVETEQEVGRVQMSCVGMVVAFASGSRKVVTGNVCGDLYIWDLSSSVDGREFIAAGGAFTVRSVAFSPGGRWVAAGSQDGVRVWDANTSDQVAMLHVPPRSESSSASDVFGLAFASDGRHLAAAVGDGTVRVWDLVRRAEIAVYYGHHKAVGRVAYSPDRRQLASVSDDRTLRIWDAYECPEALPLKSNGVMMRNLAFSADGRRCVTGSVHRNSARVWNSDTGEEVLAIDHGPSGSCLAAVSPDGDRLATAFYGIDRIQVFDIDSGSRLAEFPDDQKKLMGKLEYSPDGAYIILESEQCSTSPSTQAIKKVINVIHAATGEVVVDFVIDKPGCGCLAISPDQRRIAVGEAYPGKVRLWDVATNREIPPLLGHTRWVNVVAFSPNSRYLASACHAKSLRIYDFTAEKELLVISNLDADVNSVTFSKDHSRIAVQFADETVRIWDLLTGQNIETIVGNMDLRAVAEDPVTRPWRAVQRGDEMVIEASDSASAAAWLPFTPSPPTSFRYVVADPSGLRWAASDDVTSYLRLFQLELGPSRSFPVHVEKMALNPNHAGKKSL